MRTPNDTTLAGIAKQLSAVTFLTTLNPDKETLDRLTGLYRTNRLNGVNILLGRNNTTVFVREYVGGQYRTFATRGVDWLSAARLADMVTFRFGAVRLRASRQVPDSEFNFSRAQAEKDWTCEPEIAKLLLQAEEHLRSIGALFDPAVPKQKTETQLDRIERKLDQLLNENKS